MGAAASIRDFEVSLQWRAEFIHLGMTLSLRREAALDEIVVAAALLFTNGQTTERTFVTAERLGRAEVECCQITHSDLVAGSNPGGSPKHPIRSDPCPARPLHY